MVEPSLRSSRLAIAAGLAAAIAIGGGGFLLGRSTVPRPEPAATLPPPAPAPTAEAPVPADDILRRSDLIALGAAAADAATSARDLPAQAAAVAGKRFELDIPFGCDGPAPETSELPMRWRYDAAAGALRVHVAPVSWAPTEWWAAPPAAVEALEGFWIERPWSSSETCPARAEPPAAPAEADAPSPPVGGETLGIAQLITPDTPRQMQRSGKAYEAVVRMAGDAVAIDRGLRLRLSGRIGRFPDGQPVRCRDGGGPHQRPICLIAVSLDEVAFQNPADDALLATWQPTADTPAGDRLRE
ncbi:hypothetical protein [Sphingomonas sp. IC4-52]|uniref:hypothetical protein n=1 Tax=Sphingomonas sp. IC4-52 TaxID=2887202 RepID=UPI001D12BE07|nr:hypothetical protein [Sphingomonas sp. IC4-52]MCC2980972.1 hypothetical protein [Sphingomonas sp. IC4-52]